MSKNILKRQIVETKDGSQTLIIPELGEQYHSLNGAVQESNHVFINAGLNSIEKQELVKVFEVGFGTGLNALLTYVNKKGRKIKFCSIEKYPLLPDEFNALKYDEVISPDNSLKNVFTKMQKCKWDKYVAIDHSFDLQKLEVDLNEFRINETFDLIYFDAFAPEIQPKLWTVEVFQKMFDLLNQNGTLVTYCAKGQVRRNMQEVGFKVERLPGPPGKREMLRAIKD